MTKGRKTITRNLPRCMPTEHLSRCPGCHSPLAAYSTLALAWMNKVYLPMLLDRSAMSGIPREDMSKLQKRRVAGRERLGTVLVFSKQYDKHSHFNLFRSPIYENRNVVRSESATKSAKNGYCTMSEVIFSFVYPFSTSL